jgi:ferrous iron transport protein A
MIKVNSSVTLTLADLARGERARIESVQAGDATTLRLLDLGLVEGTEIFCVRAAPFGDPREYELRGVRLCLRRSEARRIHIVKD